MVARASAPKRKPTADMGWERGHTGGIIDRRPPLGPGVTPPPVGAKPGKPRQPSPAAHAPGWTRGHATGLPTGPTATSPRGPAGLPPQGAFRTPQATTGRGVQPQSAFRTPQATTGRDVKPLKPTAAKAKVKINPRSPNARAAQKNTGNAAGRRRL